MAEPTVWFNADCSKCRSVHAILSERGIDATYVDYLRETPTSSELKRVLLLLGTSDPRAIARTGEDLWDELRLEKASDDEILDALQDNPILIERPIVIVGDRAVVGRPPERVLDLVAPTS